MTRQTSVNLIEATERQVQNLVGAGFENFTNIVRIAIDRMHITETSKHHRTTTFANLQIGERFHFNIDADGHEPYMYKVSSTEAFIEHGSHSGMREEITQDEMVHVWSKPAILHDTPTEIERAALTLLMPRGHAGAGHVGLGEYIRALATDPNERRDLDKFIWETDVNVETGEVPEMMPLRELCAEHGQVCWHKRWDNDNSATGAILDRKPTGKRPTTADERHAASEMRAIAILAHAVLNYRIAGRAEGDQSHTISGMGSPLLTVTTSLAAAVAEYHNSIVNNLQKGDQANDQKDPRPRPAQVGHRGRPGGRESLE